MRANKESRRKFFISLLKTAAGLGVLSIGGVYLAPNRANATNQIQLKLKSQNLKNQRMMVRKIHQQVTI